MSNWRYADYTEEEIEQIKEERDWWKKLADLLGWRLYGWTFKHVATFIDKEERTVTITGQQRDDILSVSPAITGYLVKLAIDISTPLTNPRLNEVEWDTVASVLTEILKDKELLNK